MKTGESTIAGDGTLWLLVACCSLLVDKGKRDIV